VAAQAGRRLAAPTAGPSPAGGRPWLPGHERRRQSGGCSGGETQRRRAELWGRAGGSGARAWRLAYACVRCSARQRRRLGTAAAAVKLALLSHGGERRNREGEKEKEHQRWGDLKGRGRRFWLC
jgi:hypothetical protein